MLKRPYLSLNKSIEINGEAFTSSYSTSYRAQRKLYLYVLTGDEVRQCLGVLASPIAKIGIAAYPAVEIHQALAVPGQVDRARHNVNVHKVVNYPTLNVALMLVHQHLLAGVVYLHERQVALAILVQRPILLLIVLDSQHEVREHLLLVHICVIRTADLHLEQKKASGPLSATKSRSKSRLGEERIRTLDSREARTETTPGAVRVRPTSAYFHNVLLDDLRIVAHRLDEEELEAHLVDDDVAYQLAPLHGGVGGVEHRDLAVAALQPLAHVVQGVHRALGAYRHRLNVVGTEELVALVSGGGVPPVLAQVEHLRADADPIQVSAQLLGYVGLAARRQTDHRDHVGLVHEIGAFTCNRPQGWMSDR